MYYFGIQVHIIVDTIHNILSILAFVGIGAKLQECIFCKEEPHGHTEKTKAY